ncbi:hypothetical protein H0H92_012844 [Tricholoma furcatifolium]|nr:hypothetical protein H0H92_012844 [Tricholoma furcatifolium]
MANVPKGAPRVPTMSAGQTVLFGGSIVAASLGGFYWNLRRMQAKKAERGDLPHYEYLLAHVASRGLANPVPGAAEVPLARQQRRASPLPGPVRQHMDHRTTVANYQPSPNSSDIRGRLEQPTPQRAKALGSDVVYTKSPEYAKSYDKVAKQGTAAAPPTAEKTDIPEVLGVSPRFSLTPYRRADPWPLPGTPEHLAKTTTPEAEANVPPARLARPNEPIDTLRARLVYQSRKRGTLESDLLLSTFARDNLSTMTEGELKEYDRLLDEADWDIYYWATGKKTPPERWTNSEILKRLVVHAKNEGKVVRLMPAL